MNWGVLVFWIIVIGIISFKLIEHFNLMKGIKKNKEMMKHGEEKKGKVKEAKVKEIEVEKKIW